MLAVSPPLFSTSHGWALEDLITQNLAQEANSYNTLVDFHTFDQIKADLAPTHSSLSSTTGDDNQVAKKLNHNASERDRRKKVNELYAFLRSLLPISSDQKKKLSIPKTVSRALKYIPELEKEVETLRCKREKMSPYSTLTTNANKEHSSIKKHSVEDTTKSSVISSVSILGEKEVVIQVISSADEMSQNKKSNLLLSKVLEKLEQKENELVLINATTFKCPDDGMLLSTLHLQVQGDRKPDAEKVKELLDQCLAVPVIR
ncbi:hypothetical protein QVD17_15740 [Tagetes erecta]|uniref:BHLH domain-containing protein n=1 Tax=Tagetes erecta TaxID=13708 RepID=A0AAD8KSX7_TARER|nr:hypothetical protein QVD17_15740 [Tagetes erecta]